jgi:hypothetical protein
MIGHVDMISQLHRYAYLLFAVGIGCALICGGNTTAYGDTAKKDAQLLKLRTERVIVFKDGYCMIVKRGSAVTDSKGEIYTEEVPDSAVLGSFWAGSDQGRMISMQAGWKSTTETVAKRVPCTQNIEILKANTGKVCKVELTDKTIHTGTIREVLVQETEVPVPATLRSSFLLPETAVHPEVISNISASCAVVRTEGGDVLLPINQIRTLTIHDMNTTIERTVTTKKRAKRLTFRFEKPGQRHELLVMYFRPGLRWIPTYRIELASEEQQKKMATVTLQAEIINEAEDLVDVPVDIVVGVPNFRFRNMPSPLVLERTLRNALQQAAPQLMRQFDGNNSFSNAIMSQRAAVVAPRPVAADASIQLPAELTAGGTQDLFVYNLPRLDFEKGQRTAVQIFEATVPYRDVYTWDLHFKRKDIEASPSGAGLNSPLTLSRNEVWHQIELTNNTNVPWTTGAALIMHGHQPLGQELMTYTSSKRAVRVPVTISVDTRGTYAEEETARKLQAITWDHHHYAKIDKKSRLHLRNSKAIPIDVEISFRFGGKFDEISDKGVGVLGAFNGSDWEQYRGSNAVNNSSTVRWNTTIEPGKTFDPTVKYHYYTRH